MASVRKDLPELPRRMRALPVDARGYPVPWFVMWLDEREQPCPNGVGRPDFRVVTAEKIRGAIQRSLCWVCGDFLGVHKSFVIGPMCAVNRTSSEPPSHIECADFSARACPFLVKPHMRRREAGMPEAHEQRVGAILRNPGVALVWTTKKYTPFIAGRDSGKDDLLIELGPPEHVRWYCEGRKATRDEVLLSIETGLPLLRKEAERDGAAGLAELARMTKEALALLPGAAP